MTTIQTERVVALTDLLLEVENAPDDVESFFEAMMSGEDGDYSPETWEQQLNLLSHSGFIEKLGMYVNDDDFVKVLDDLLKSLGSPWVAISL